MQDKLLDIADGTLKGDQHTKEFQMPNLEQISMQYYWPSKISYYFIYYYSYNLIRGLYLFLPNSSKLSEEYLPLQYKDINFILN